MYFCNSLELLLIARSAARALLLHQLVIDGRQFFAIVVGQILETDSEHSGHGKIGAVNGHGRFAHVGFDYA